MPLSLYDMILQQQPATRDPSSTFQQAMARDPQARGLLGMPFPFGFLSGLGNDDRSDQNNRGNQSDPGNTMAPPGQTPPGGPDDRAMSGYDPTTVGYQPAAWMRALAGMSGGQRDPRRATNLSLLGLSMLSPRQPTAPRPLPWI